MANPLDNLIHKDFSKMPNHKELASKGGSRSTPKKKWAARLTALKRKGLTNDTYRKIYAIMTEKESFALENYLNLQKWLAECTDVKEKVMIGRLMNDLMKNLHGDQNVQTNIQINVMSEDSTKAAIARLLNEDNIITVGDDIEE